ncbi:hypothetical protein [Enterococcus ureasiticus]|uniref:Membrane protein 6-pyruvoyl-tetrahydropterin synthase-related domain-containing protein n=1 Tax=Enterococcus ureasiticus TaxID=903984 RepID=A0A1E5GAJ3_9ENTE|nr:hypothetical protein [Enterococcus ureasiticus]OEG09713.1 hypothetical protein BCR21_15350 [Enterococcus ureasiticus]
MLKVKMKKLFKEIPKLPIGYLYFLFFVISYISVYVPYIQGMKINLGHDTYFHLNRIESLYNAISAGDYFPRIAHFFAFGMGYASSIFYSDIFLYPAALLRCVGFSLGLSYMYYMLLVTFLTFVVAYHSFHSISHSKQKSLFFAILYGLSSYRIADVVVRGALGEILALMVLPIALAGLIQIVRGNEKKFYVLSTGMASLFFSHTLSTLIFCLFIVGYLLLNIPILVKEKRRIVYLIYATLLTILMVIVNLLPTVEQLIFQKLNVQSDQIFDLQTSAASIVEYIQNAMLNKGFNNLGWLIIVAILFLLIRIKRITVQNKQLLLLGIVFFVLATDHFPHYLFHDTMFNTIQFPWRYFIIVTISITWVLADSLSVIFRNKRYQSFVVASCAVLFLLGSVIHFELVEGKKYKMEYNSFSKLDGYDLGVGKEYLPAGMNYQKTVNEISGIYTSSKDIKINDADRSYNMITFNYTANPPTTVTLPIIYYKGYVAEVTGSGKISKVEESKEFKGLSEVTVSGEGTVEFWYKGTIIQKVSFGVSLVTWISLAGYLINKRKIKYRTNNEL